MLCSVAIQHVFERFNLCLQLVMSTEKTIIYLLQIMFWTRNNVMVFMICNGFFMYRINSELTAAGTKKKLFGWL